MPEIHVVSVALLTARDRVLVTRRPAAAPLPGEWQFPGGRVEFGEHPWDALRRELREELGIRVTRGRLFGVYSHVYDLEGSTVHYVLIAYEITSARHRVPETESRVWATVTELRRMPILAGSRPIVRDLATRPRGAVT